MVGKVEGSIETALTHSYDAVQSLINQLFILGVGR